MDVFGAIRDSAEYLRALRPTIVSIEVSPAEHDQIRAVSGDGIVVVKGAWLRPGEYVARRSDGYGVFCLGGRTLLVPGIDRARAGEQTIDISESGSPC